MSRRSNVKLFLVEWVLEHGDNWVHPNDVSREKFILFDISRDKKYLDGEDQFPADKNLWAEYFRISKKGKRYVSMCM